jgi:hypothetical protein
MKARYLDVGGVVGQEENWPKELVLRVEDLGTGETVPPGLSITINDT